MIKIFSTTPRLVMGPGSAKTIGAEVKARGAKRVLVVTDKGVIGAGLLKSIEESFKAAKITCSIFDKVEPDPRYEIVADCVKTAQSIRAQMLA